MKDMNEQILKWQKWEIDFSCGAVIMGILNTTPDSFSDGGLWLDEAKAVEHGIEMANQGAAIIDVGAESTRPGAEKIPAEEQIKRAVNIIKKLAVQIKIPISIDTQDYDVAEAAVEAGASIINDISGFSDPKMIELASQKQLPIVIMHMKGNPQNMQENPVYDDVVGEVLEFLVQRANLCIQAGIKKDMIFIDPGIGFGKTFEHNIMLVKNIKRLTTSGFRVLIGSSRKKFIGQITNKLNPAERIFGTAATVAIAAQQGVDVVRVHDVQEMIDTIKVANVLRL
jgi:dihydropteroate synthase